MHLPFIFDTLKAFSEWLFPIRFRPRGLRVAKVIAFVEFTDMHEPSALIAIRDR